MRSSSSWLLRGGLTAISLLALSACVEGTTSSATATSPSEAAGPPAPAVTPGSPASPVVNVPATPPVATTPPVAATPPAPATGAQPSAPLPVNAPAVTLITLDGTWESASCGDRAYPRRITFAEAANFIAEDLISPCPKGVSCVWSGIINRRGTYKVERDTITLTVSKTSSGPAKSELPPTLTLDGNRAPVETGSDGKACVYKHTTATKKP
jgi:hypothetical protein